MITVLTPTFNRKFILPMLYKSLLKQTSMDFEWIVIDDGSTDNTKELISEWSKSTKSFVIRYVFQENGGKHRAINRGVKMALYNYCFIVDSDDTITEHAIECIITWVRTIEGDKSLAGVSGLKGFKGGGQIGGYPKGRRYEKYIDKSNLERQKFNLGGDKAEVYRTEILRLYPFPEFDGEKFLSEAVVWNSIAWDGYKIRWFNEIIYRCDYIDDGLTKMGMKKNVNNFEGYTYYIRQSIEMHGWLAKQLLMGSYYSVAKQKGLNFANTAERLEIRILPLLLANVIFTVKNTLKHFRNIAKYLINLKRNLK